MLYSRLWMRNSIEMQTHRTEIELVRFMVVALSSSMTAQVPRNSKLFFDFHAATSDESSVNIIVTILSTMFVQASDRNVH